MTFIHMETYRAACKEADPVVDRITLMDAIFRVYEMWFSDLRSGEKVVFHAYFGLSLLEMGIGELFLAERYRKALGAYFNPRALKRLAQLRQIKLELPKNPVERATRSNVRIRVNASTSLEFRALKRCGKLKWSSVAESFKIIHVPSREEIPDEVRHGARRQALAIMNDKRGFPARSSNQRKRAAEE